jgi:hypothetical protein
MSNESSIQYTMDPRSVPRCVRINAINKARIMNDEKIIESITQEIPNGTSSRQQKVTALLSYIALGGSILSLGGMFYLYFNGEPVPPEECMDDSTYNMIIESCNKLFTTYWKNEDKTSCEIQIDNFNNATAEYNNTLDMLRQSLIGSSVAYGAIKIVQVASWVKKRFSDSMCSVQGGRRRYKKKGKSRRRTKKRKSRRRTTKKRMNRK